MEKRKAITMLIARYRADSLALGQRETYLLRQIEIIENLIPTVTISYMSRSIRSGQMLLPHQEVEEAKERLEYLKHSLRELQQSIGMVRKEAEIMNERIVELETHLIEKNNQYTNLSRTGNLSIWNDPYENDNIRAESVKTQSVNLGENQSSVLQQKIAKDNEEIQPYVTPPQIINEITKSEVKERENLISEVKNQREKLDFEKSKSNEPKPHSSRPKNYITPKSDDPNNQGNFQKKDVIREKDIEIERLKDVKPGRLKQSQSIKPNESSPSGKGQHLDGLIDVADPQTNHSTKTEDLDKIDYNVKPNEISQQSDKTMGNAVPESNDKLKDSVTIIGNATPKSNDKAVLPDKTDNVISKSPEKAQCSDIIIANVFHKLEDEEQYSDQSGLTPQDKINDYLENIFVPPQPDVADRFSDNINTPHLEIEENNSDKIASIVPKPEDVNQRLDIITFSSDDSDVVRILQEMTDTNNDNEQDFNLAVLDDQGRQIYGEMLGNGSNIAGNISSKSDLPVNRIISPQISNEICDKEREVKHKDNRPIKYNRMKIEELQKPARTSITQTSEEIDDAIPISDNVDQFSDKVIGSAFPNTDDNLQDQIFNMLGRPSSFQKLEEQESKIPLWATDEKGKFVENYDELLDMSLKFEELLKAENTNWKQIHEKLTIQINELSENLINASLKINLYEEYVKHLEKKIYLLENELKVRIDMLEQKRAKCAEAKIKQDLKALTANLITLGEGEGVTPAYMQLAHWRFALKLPEYQGDRELKEKLMNGIKQGNMAPYYKEVCDDLGWKFDSKLYDEMSAANVKRLEELEKEHENNVMDEEDQSQLCGVWQSKLDYLCSIGDRENASALANSKVDDKTVPKSHRIDAVFSLFRISFFHGCNIKGMSTAIEKATELIEGISGGDWSARNKLKAYEGVWSLAIRDFTRAAHLFVDVVPTFESYELADFGTIIRYTVLSCMIALPRCDLRKKLMLHGVMAQALHSQYQDLREYFISLYDGRYSDFLVCLARIEVEMKRDPLLHPHYRHYVQEMRLRAYKQILQAYRSLSLDYMAQSFGVTSEFIEREVARFAAAGRLQCKIDSVAGTVITSAHLDDSVRSKEAPEASLDRNILYQTTVKRGDILLNRLKKLARVMDF